MLAVIVIVLSILLSGTALVGMVGAQNQSMVAIGNVPSGITVGTPQAGVTVGSVPAGVTIGSVAQTGVQGTFPMAVYSMQAPAANMQRALLTYNQSLTGSVYSNGTYIPGSSLMPGASPIFWVETSSGWSWYASVPLGSWARELMYIPTAGPVQVYEISPSGMTQAYDLGQAQSGYSYIWFNGNVQGRHTSMFTVNGIPSNAVMIDVPTTAGLPSYPATSPQVYPINASSSPAGVYTPGTTTSYSTPGSTVYSTPGMTSYSTSTGSQGTYSSSSGSGTSSSSTSY